MVGVDDAAGAAHDEAARVEGLLRGLGVDPADLLGFGGEARVWALGADRVVRLCHPGTPTDAVHQRIELLDTLSSGPTPPPWALPEVLAVHEREGRLLTVERRLDGIPLLAALGAATGDDRRRLIEAHLEAAAALAELSLPPTTWFGQLIGDDPVRSPTWPAFLEARASISLIASGLGDQAWSTSLAAELAAAVLAVGPPDAASKVAAAGPPGLERCFVHLDAFAGNMMAVGNRVTAVLDFGPTCLAGGDPRIDPVACAVYLGSAHITPTATAADLGVARSWLRERGMDDLYEPLRRWLAAFWSFAVDDAKLFAWCCSVLGR